MSASTRCGHWAYATFSPVAGTRDMGQLPPRCGETGEPMRNVLMVCLSLPLAACDQLGGSAPEVEHCEQRILERMANPDSYSRGEYTSLSLGDRWQVGIEYSHVDATGRKVTDAWQTCDYPIVDGKPDTSRLLSVERSAPD